MHNAEERRAEPRRIADVPPHSSPCPLLQDHMILNAGVHADLTEIKAMLSDIREMVSMFKNAKGAIKMIMILGDIVKWTAVVGAGAVAVFLWFKK